MKQTYEKAALTVTHFAEEDIIITSAFDRNNAYRSLSELNEKDSRILPDR